jgi:hypothetical protein
MTEKMLTFKTDRERRLLFIVVFGAMVLGWTTMATAGQLPATGQTTCWDSAGAVIPCAGTGQDGEIQAGAKLRYKDNGDGTIKDKNTKLTWEKLSADGSIHDAGNAYNWADAFAVHVTGLNTANFAGHNDWRLPNIKELQSIVNYQKFAPSVSSPFNNNCVAGATVLTGSCTVGNAYWSSTSYTYAPMSAWFINFIDGGVGVGTKSSFFIQVRAVRGGLTDEAEDQ